MSIDKWNECYDNTINKYWKTTKSKRLEEILTKLDSLLEESLTNDISFWLPYILLNAIEVNSEPDFNKVSIKINFRVTSQGANQTIILEVDSQGELSIA